MGISVSGVRQFLSCFIAHLSHFVNHIDFCWKTYCSLAGNKKGCCLHLGVVFSLCSIPTVMRENRVNRLQPKLNSLPFRFRPTSNESLWGDICCLACGWGWGEMFGALWICWVDWADCRHLLAIRPARECVFRCLLCLLVGREAIAATKPHYLPPLWHAVITYWHDVIIYYD